ncbi:erg24, C-14 sterol reductase [Tulasnella sp. 330]|nr:erg24, C-14 sterol reductase [Tulasnella sp. 330]KAG8886610.1 erg24, C-14 sterol reductase [Tulasnella sp. 331]KAG8890697.1 erg24, C-14 sterol reductase [Tulasnella sp. 332]
MAPSPQSTDMVAHKKLNPKTTKLEFFGVPGTFLLVTTLPFVVYGLYFSCSEETGGCPPNLYYLGIYVSQRFSNFDGWMSICDTQAAAVFAGWLVYMIACWRFLPGDWVEGQKIRDGTVQKYKINALPTLLFTLGVVSGWIYKYGPESFTFLYEHYLGFITATTVFSYATALLLYIYSFGPDKLLALAGNSGYFVHDYWMGRELNPTFGSLDFKSWSELRPGMIGWVLINISCACEQAVRRGGSITDSMALVLLFQGLYVFDALYNEPSILTTMDITTDGFGFMLVFGDYAWLPLTYSLQARFLAFNPVELGWGWVSIILAVNALGYYIFRSSNAEKNDFRNGNNPKGLTFMETRRGTKLLTSGWWGKSRHPNYMGDLIMAFSWCMPTGFTTPLTYFYPVYFFVLLAHRQYRDDEACEKKYGDDWTEYKKRVPSRIFPGIY